MKYFQEQDNSLIAAFKFANFKKAMAFMVEVAFYCEEQNHHPNWSNVYNTVNIVLTTHDAGNIVTDKDYKLAASIEQVYASYSV